MAVLMLVLQLLMSAIAAMGNGLFFGAGFAVGAMIVERKLAKLK